MQYADRADAGRRLAAVLIGTRIDTGVVLGLARGGMPLAAEVARLLDAPLDVLVVRKLGVPWQPELGVGALAEGGAAAVDQVAVAALGLTRTDLDRVEAIERAELARRVRAYRGDRPPLAVDGRTAVLVDDGLATGGTAIAAVRALRERGAARVVVAVPVASAEAVQRLRWEADEVVCPLVPPSFGSVGRWYADFGQVTDEEVVRLLTTGSSSSALHDGGVSGRRRRGPDRRSRWGRRGR